MLVIRIILGIIFAIVIVRGIIFLGTGQGIGYPIAMIATGAAADVVLIFASKKKS